MRKKMITQKLVEVRLIQPLQVQGKKKGSSILRREEHAAKLVKMGKAEYIEAKPKPEVKEEKAAPIETKEEKFAPAETKAVDLTEKEVKDYSGLSVRKLGEEVGKMTEEELLNIVKTDERKTAVRLAEEEIRRREAPAVS